MVKDRTISDNSKIQVISIKVNYTVSGFAKYAQGTLISEDDNYIVVDTITGERVRIAKTAIVEDKRKLENLEE